MLETERYECPYCGEEAEAVEGLGPGADAGGGLVAAHEGVVEARGGQAAEDGGDDAVLEFLRERFGVDGRRRAHLRRTVERRQMLATE